MNAKTFPEYLDEYLTRRGIASDRQLALSLSVSPQYVWKMRHMGKATDDFCLEIAAVLQIEGGAVLIARNALKESGAVGEAWKRLLGKVAGILLLLGLNPVDLRADSSIAVQWSMNSVTQVLDSPSKDYRKFRIRQLRQMVARFFQSMFPVIAHPWHPLSNAL